MNAAASKPYAQGTKVTAFKSLHDIDALLSKAGATDRATFRLSAREGVYFKRDGIVYKISVFVPMTEEEAKTFAGKRGRNGHGTWVETERARRLRVLLNVVKAKIMSVDEDVFTWEEAFGSDIVINATTGETVGEYAAREAQASALGGRALNSLPMPGGEI